MFERYTEPARRTIFFARYRASQKRSREIETEHLLWAMLKDDFKLMTTLLGEASAGSLRAVFELPEPSITNPLTNEATQITVNLHPKRWVPRWFFRLLIDPRASRVRYQDEVHDLDWLAKRLRESYSSRGSPDMALCNECKRVLAYTAEEAERLGHRHIGNEHLLLGLFRETRSEAARLLREVGCDIEIVRARAMRLP